MISDKKITDDVICQAVDVDDAVVPPGDCDQTKDVIIDVDVSDDNDVLTENNSESLVSSSVVAEEQRDDVTLKGCFKMADMKKGHFAVIKGLLYHRDRILGQDVNQLVVPISCRKFWRWAMILTVVTWEPSTRMRELLILS